MKILPKVFVRLLSACAVAIVLSATPASSQEALKEADELNTRVIKLYQAGKYAEAIPLAQQALEIREKVLGPDHPKVAASINNLANLYQAIGDYAKAELFFRRSLGIAEKALGPDHPSVATVLNNLAELYRAMGDYAKAEPFYLQALEISEKALGPEHRDVAASLNNLAQLYYAIGDDAKAEPLYQRALVILEKVLGTDHPDVAFPLSNLALIYKDMGDYAKAEPLDQRALGIWEKALGPDHPDVALSLNNLAVLYYSMDDYAKAEPLYRRALAIDEKALGTSHPKVAVDLNNLANLYQNLGDYAKAEPLYRRSLAIKEKALGPEHPDVATSLNNLATLEAAQQQYRSAFGSCKKGLAIEDRHIQNVFTIRTEEQKLIFIQSISANYIACLSLIHQHLSADREAVRDGLELVLRRKGVVFDAQSRAREALQGRLSKEAKKEWDRLSALRSELAKLLLHKPDKMNAEEYKSKLASLQQQIEEIEKRLAGESALVAKELKQRTITVEAAMKTLSKDAALVEFVKISDSDFAKGQLPLTERYLAFVLTAAGDITLVDLGDASALEALAQRALTDIKTSLGTRGIEIRKAPCARSVDPRGIEVQPAPCGRDAGRQSAQLLQELHAQVWAPLEKVLGNAEKVVLSPDSLLNLIPFAALVDSQGHSVVERYQLAYVTSGRELIGMEEAFPKPDSDLLLVANPAFGQKVQSMGSTVASVLSRDFRGVFNPLPGTEREAMEIPPLVTDRGGKRSVLVESDATEGSVKSARSPRILHLATHGFFLQDEEIDPCGETRGVTVVKKATPDEKALCEKARGVTVVKQEKLAPSKRYENPLVRSGLAFAGANHASEITEGDDGILTALEITGMDLYGTELVVLSACDTGVGEVKTGEGVFGLRRAFALAGAKNLLMSLWAVDDETTANQMKAFYRNLQKLPPAEALRQAQLATIAELKTKYNGAAPPGLWAPFILQGAQALGQ